MRIPGILLRLSSAHGVSILMYHGVVAERLPFHNWCFVTARSFREQMAYLKRHVEVLRLPEAMNRPPGDRPSAVITFDDGYQNNADVALPILREFDLPATVFLTTGLVDSDDTVWDSRLYLALSETRRNELEWEERHYRWRGPDELARVFRSMKQALKQSPQDDLERRLRSIMERLGVDPRATVPEGSAFRILSGASIAAMGSSGLIDFGAHTHHHTILSQLDSTAKRSEIETSIRETARRTGKPCTLFAFPNGSPADYDPECLERLREAGIRWAVTTIEAPNTPETPPLELRRYGIGGGLSLARFQLKLHHAHHALQSLKSSLR